MEDPNESALPPLSDQDLLIIEGFSPEMIAEIDQELLGRTNGNWQKTAKVVGGAFITLSDKYNDIPMGYFILRLKHFESKGLIEVKGVLEKMRFSELRATQ